MKKAKIIERWQVAVMGGGGIRGASRGKVITMVRLEDGRKMSFAEYRKLATAPTAPARE